MILDSKNNYWKGVSLSIKMNTKGGNMEIVYNMVAYKSKVIPENIYISIDNTTEGRYSFLPSLHISGTKYRF